MDAVASNMASTIVKKSTGIYKSVVGVVAGSVMLDAPATVAINAAGVITKAMYSSLYNEVGVGYMLVICAP